MTINAFPCAWPNGWKRTQPHARRSARFGKARERHGRTPARPLTVTDATIRVLTELERMGIQRDDCVISTNVPLRLDGLPRGGTAEPDDPSAVVYWRDSFDARRVMAIDQYDRVADNLAAIAATLDAMRAIERHGGAMILERAFTGFTALPAPPLSDAVPTWWAVLGLERAATREEAKAAHRRLASQYHPDKPGGSNAKMAEINAALAQAEQETA